MNRLLECHNDKEQIWKFASPSPHTIKTFEANFKKYLHYL